MGHILKVKNKWTSLLILLLFCSTSFFGATKARHHSFGTPLHFHTSEHEVDHHREANNEHSNEENETIVSLDLSIIKHTTYSLDLSLLVFSLPHASQLHFDTKDYLGKLSSTDPPIIRMNFRSFQPNAPPALA